MLMQISSNSQLQLSLLRLQQLSTMFQKQRGLLPSPSERMVWQQFPSVLHSPP